MDSNPRTPTPPPRAEAEGGQSQSPPQSQSSPPPQSPPPQSQSQPQSHSFSPPQHHHQLQPQSRPQSPPIPSPALSRLSPSILHPSTPQPEDPAEDYFHRVSDAPSRRSRLSTFSINRLPSSTPSENRPPARPDHSRRPSIRIRLSNASINRAQPNSPERAASSHGPEHIDAPGGRSRSASQSSAASAPADTTSAARNASRLTMQPDISSPARSPRRMVQASLPRLTEEGSRPTMAELGLVPVPRPQRPSIAPSDPAADEDGEHEEKGSQEAGPSNEKGNRLRRVSRFFWPSKARRGSADPGSVTSAETRHEDEYHEELVDWLDIIDPEVQTLSTLTNVQNSLFIPDLGTWVNRRPTYVLSQPDMRSRRPATAEGRVAEVPDTQRDEAAETEPSPEAAAPEHPTIQRSTTITSRLSESHYASLPHGRTLDGWSAADKQELDDRVRHMLHSRRSKFKRMMKGFGQYVRRPLGFFVTLYALLITLFGLAWVLFLIGWIYVGEEQPYAVHVIDSILVALFAIMGDGLAPFRAVDTYHMIFVLRYSRMIKNAGKPPRARLRKSHGRPEVRNEAITDVNGHGILNEQAMTANGGDQHDATDVNLEDGKSGGDIPGYYPLNAKQVKSLLHHQKKLAKSHSFYKPQETHTHFSFPLNFLVAIVILLDFHSCLQISLGACTWGINYHVRPFALTTVILCVSITCNLSAGLVITAGDRKTRKKDVMKLLDRQELTEDAIARMEHKKEKEEERRREAILERMAAA
ncbi:integral membrane protein [Hirsutella rhossiliensis]|uniref:Integral membrane protein n=1 Tax=Hirsutella rhossiliensis TaxID=111463 RepID=A0A9P8N662_9HYPO|nr:uncharacterized protein HRG_00307 [Hirsutella rhossiliensis]KAH0967665.1 integral membrane protein [Hirsutella rhossiliensis]